MKERPILFSGPMVRAILDDKKTQTRRIVKRPLKHPNWTGYMLTAEKDGAIECGPDYPDDDSDFVKNPYGVPGDQLWVREAFQPFYQDGFIYLADAGTGRLNAASVEEAKVSWPEWKSPIHMPRKASRLTLEITDVRVQRLQEISEEDAKAEGMRKEDLPWDPDNFHPPGSYGYVGNYNPTGMIWPTPQQAFKESWNMINSKRAPWDSNPWVWAITFRRI